MGEVRLKVPRLRRISGRYFWRPTKAVKALGFVAEALGSDLEKAIERARYLNAEVEKERLGFEVTQLRPGTMADLIRIYRKDDGYKALRDSTRRGYDSILNEIERVAGQVKAAAVTRKGLKKTYREIRDNRGRFIAVAHMRVWQILMGVAIDEELRTDNPAAKMKIGRPPRRTVRPTLMGVLRFCVAARAQGRPSMGLAALLAFELCQRQGDVLRLSWTAWDGDCFTIRQSKTGAAVRVPATAVLRKAIAAAPKVSTAIVVCESTGRPYTDFHFRHEFTRIARLAKVGFQFRDLRRGGLSEGGDAGATVHELQGGSGHRTIAELQTYVVPSDAMARALQEKRERRRKRNEVAKDASSGGKR